MPRDRTTRSRSPDRRGRRSYRSRSRSRSPKPSRHRSPERNSHYRGGRSSRYSRRERSRERDHARDTERRGRDTRSSQSHRRTSSKRSISPSSRTQRVRSTSPSPVRQKTRAEKELTEVDMQEMTEEEQMKTLLGFGGFDSTKGKKVAGNEVGVANVKKQRKFRQYMNRKGGFNRLLDKQ